MNINLANLALPTHIKADTNKKVTIKKLLRKITRMIISISSEALSILKKHFKSAKTIKKPFTTSLHFHTDGQNM